MSSEIQNNQYEEMQQRNIAAFKAFDATYTIINPPPIKRHDRIGIDKAITIIGIGVVVIAAMIVSGSRTIAEFGEVGFFAFGMLEIGSLIFAVKRAMAATAHQERFGNWLTKAGLVVCLVVMLAGNLDATLKKHNTAQAENASAQSIESDFLTIAIAVAIALSAPLLTAISGDLLGVEIVDIVRSRDKSEITYRNEIDAYRDKKTASWDAQKARMGAGWKVEKPVPLQIPNSIPDGSNGMNGMESGGFIPSVSTLGHSKKPNASELVRSFFQDNPSLLFEESLDWKGTAQQLGVGKSTFFNVRTELRNSPIVDMESNEQE